MGLDSLLNFLTSHNSFLFTRIINLLCQNLSNQITSQWYILPLLLHALETGTTSSSAPAVAATAITPAERECKPKHPPSVFTDEKGNLKFVNLIVAHPCKIFFLVLGLCLAIVVALFNQAAFADGLPFTPNEHEYDLFDQRSMAYDSLRLAKEKVTADFEKNFRQKRNRRKIEEFQGGDSGENDGMEEVKLQENLGDVTYFIYEAKKKTGLFTEEALKLMRASEIMITGHKRYTDYCMLDYEVNLNGEEVAQCRKSASITNIFYASQWNSTLAREILTDLTENNIHLYNNISSCVEQNILCDYVAPSVTAMEFRLVTQLHYKILSMMVHWDGEGDLNEDLDEVSLFIATIARLFSKSPFVDFYFDGNFTVDNPVAMYSRSIVYWGSPLEGTNEKKASREILKR